MVFSPISTHKFLKKYIHTELLPSWVRYPKEKNTFYMFLLSLHQHYKTIGPRKNLGSYFSSFLERLDGAHIEKQNRTNFLVKIYHSYLNLHVNPVQNLNYVSESKKEILSTIFFLFGGIHKLCQVFFEDFWPPLPPLSDKVRFGGPPLNNDVRFETHPPLYFIRNMWKPPNFLDM